MVNSQDIDDLLELRKKVDTKSAHLETSKLLATSKHIKYLSIGMIFLVILSLSSIGYSNSSKTREMLLLILGLVLLMGFLLKINPTLL